MLFDERPLLVNRYPKWHTQLIFSDNLMRAFDGTKDLFKYYLNMAEYEIKYTQDDVAIIFVKDFNTGNWIDAKEAHFVAGSQVLGPMGRELVAFLNLEDAMQFMKIHGGEMTDSSHINSGTIHKLNMNPKKRLHHTKGMHHKEGHHQHQHHGHTKQQ